MKRNARNGVRGNTYFARWACYNIPFPLCRKLHGMGNIGAKVLNRVAIEEIT